MFPRPVHSALFPCIVHTLQFEIYFGYTLITIWFSGTIPTLISHVCMASHYCSDKTEITKWILCIAQ